MARTTNRLSARGVAALKKPGRHADGAGLYLHVTERDGISGRRWIYRYTSPVTGKVREMGLGSAANGAGVSLSRARELATEARASVQAGRDPIDVRIAEAKAQEDCRTFAMAAEALLKSKEGGWKNAKHRQQWRNTLATYAKPIANLPIEQIGTDDVLKCVSPIWETKFETASRVRGRIERVLSYAIALKWRPGPNPAAWRDNLEHLLANPKELRKRAGHHKALAWSDVPAFMADLRQREALAARALEFCILTATRTSETLGSRWSEIDLDTRVWTIPGERMKAGKPHRVPLSDAAMAVLELLKAAAVSVYVFPGQGDAKHLSNMAMLTLLRRMGRNDDTTAHGFRSAFSDWTAEQTAFPGEVREMALAHTIANKAEASYRRGDLLDKRRELMSAWADWCGSADVTSAKAA